MTEVIERDIEAPARRSTLARVNSSNENDEPPALPPIPSRASRPHAGLRVEILHRVVASTRHPLRAIARRAESHTPPIGLELRYEAMLRERG